jgi:hypothetical protein
MLISQPSALAPKRRSRKRRRDVVVEVVPASPSIARFFYAPEKIGSSVILDLTRKTHYSSLQYFRRMWLGRMFSSVRYLATVRRAMGMPRSLRIWTIS